MFNFKNLFGESQVYPDPTSIVPVTIPGKQEPKEALYKVGMNTDGQTQLAVGYPSTIILTLNDASVAHLIKLLAVNIGDNYTVTVKERDNA
jgi:hypothetical protein